MADFLYRVGNIALVHLKNVVVLVWMLNTGLVHAQDIKILVVAYNGVEAGHHEWQSTIDYLHDALPQHAFSLLPVIPGDLEKIKKLIQSSEIDFVITQPAIYVDLEMNYGVSKILTLVKKEGISEFGSVIIARSDSGIDSIDALNGTVIAGIARLGFGGWLIGYKEMLDHGFDPYEEAGEVVFLGTQLKEVAAVLERKVDAAVIRTGVLENLSLQGEINLADFQVIAAKTYPGFPYLVSTSLYPEWAFAKTQKVPNDLGQSVALALLSLNSDSKAAQDAHYEK